MIIKVVLCVCMCVCVCVCVYIYIDHILTNNLKIFMETQKTQNGQNKIEKKGIMLNDFRLHCKAIVIKTVWYYTKTDQ